MREKRSMCGKRRWKSRCEKKSRKGKKGRKERRMRDIIGKAEKGSKLYATDIGLMGRTLPRGLKCSCSPDLYLLHMVLYRKFEEFGCKIQCLFLFVTNICKCLPCSSTYLSIWHGLCHLTLTPRLGIRSYYYLHFSDVETEARMLNNFLKIPLSKYL